MDRGAWRDIVPDGVAKSWTRLSVHAYAWITHHCSVACVCQVEKLMPLYSFLRVESILSLLQEHYLHYSEQLYSSYSKLIITSIKGYSFSFIFVSDYIPLPPLFLELYLFKKSTKVTVF